MNYIETGGFERVIGPFKWIRLSIHHGWRLIRPSLNLAHTDDDMQAVVDAFRHASDELIESGFFFVQAAEEAVVADIAFFRAPAAPLVPAPTFRAKAPPSANAAALR